MGVSLVVRCLKPFVKTISSDEHFVAKAWARQVRSGVASLTNIGQSLVGAVHAHVARSCSAFFPNWVVRRSAVLTQGTALPSPPPVAQIMVYCEYPEA